MCETCGCGNSDHHHTHLMLPITGITDEESCRKLEEALNQLSGVHATADYKIGAVSLLLHEEGDLAEVKKLIEQLGYQA